MGEVVLYKSDLIDGFLRVVLAEWEGKFVTWILNEQIKSYNYGNYFTDRDEAVMDYTRRCAGHQVGMGI